MFSEEGEMNTIPSDPLTLSSGALFWVNVFLVVATFMLVIVTFRYMIHTEKMARKMGEQVDVQKREFDLKIRPVPNIRAELVSTTGTTFKIRFRIFNGGLSPFYLELIVLKFCHSEMPEKMTADCRQVNRYIFPQTEHDSGELEFDYKNDPIPGFRGLTSLKGAYIRYHINVFDLEKKSQRLPAQPERDSTLFLQ